MSVRGSSFISSLILDRYDDFSVTAKSATDVFLDSLENNENINEQDVTRFIDQTQNLQGRDRSVANSAIVTRLIKWSESRQAIAKLKDSQAVKFMCIKAISVELLSSAEAESVSKVAEQITKEGLWYDDNGGCHELPCKIALNCAVPLLDVLNKEMCRKILQDKIQHVSQDAVCIAECLVVYKRLAPVEFAALDSHSLIKKHLSTLVTTLKQNQQLAKELENTPFSIEAVNNFLLESRDLDEDRRFRSLFSKMSISSTAANAPFHQVCCRWVQTLFSPFLALERGVEEFSSLLHSENSEIAQATALRFEQLFLDQSPHKRVWRLNTLKEILGNNTTISYGKRNKEELIAHLSTLAASVGDKEIQQHILAYYLTEGKVQDATKCLRVYFGFPVCTRSIFDILREGVSGQFNLALDLFSRQSEIMWNLVLSLEELEMLAAEIQQKLEGWIQHEVCEPVRHLNFELSKDAVVTEADRKSFQKAVLLLEKRENLMPYLHLISNLSPYLQVIDTLNQANPLHVFAARVREACNPYSSTGDRSRAKQALVQISRVIGDIPELPSFVVMTSGQLRNLTQNLDFNTTDRDGQIVGILANRDSFNIVSASPTKEWINWTHSIRGSDPRGICIINRMLLVPQEFNGQISLLAYDTFHGTQLSKLDLPALSTPLTAIIAHPSRAIALAVTEDELFIIDANNSKQLAIKKLPCQEVVHLKVLKDYMQRNSEKVHFVDDSIIWKYGSIYCCDLSGTLRFLIPKTDLLSQMVIIDKKLYYSNKNYLIVRDIETNRTIRELLLTYEANLQIIVSPDARYVCCKGYDHTVSEQQCIEVFDLHTNQRVFFSNDEKMMRGECSFSANSKELLLVCGNSYSFKPPEKYSIDLVTGAKI